MLLLTGLSILVFAMPVAGQDPSEGGESKDDEMARTLFETGRAYFERAQYDDAARAFGKAYRLSGRPMLLINQARALEAGGHVHEAIEALERFEEVAPEDDRLRGTVTSMLRRYRAAAERGATEEQAGGDEADDDPEPEDPAPGARVGGDPGTTQDDGRAGLRWSGVGALSFAGLSAVVALGTGIASRRTHDSLEDDCPSDVCAPELQRDIDRGRRLGVVSTVFTFAGVGAAVAGTLLWLLGRDRGDSEEPAPRVRPTGGPGMAGAGLNVRF